ncbi:MAG TPA: YceI family protein, partial [Acidimicrobiales bacterium]|nr:YceI family protein [Acidimicrobiales bacterium]
ATATFKSTKVSGDEKKATVQGDLAAGGSSQPVTMNLTLNDSKVSGSTSFSQSGLGIKPFSAMMGALKVKDNVTVEIEGNLK